MPNLNPSILLVGCGRMGQAMLESWCKTDAFSSCTVIDPHLDNNYFHDDRVEFLSDISDFNKSVDLIVFAIKPQIAGHVLMDYQNLVQRGALCVSIIAGTSIQKFQKIFGSKARIIRTMPNTPASIGAGITALCATSSCSEDDKRLANMLMASLGETLWLQDEGQMNAVTAVSGSGPAYVFHMIESLTAAAKAQGLSEDDAAKLARQTVIGAALLVESESDTSIAVLRRNVTSPKGTTEAGLSILMEDETGLKALIRRTVEATTNRAKELSEDN